MSSFIIHLQLDEDKPSLSLTHKLETSEDMDPQLRSYYEDFSLGLLETLTSPDILVRKVRMAKTSMDFYRQVNVSNDTPPPKDNVVPLHPPKMELEGKE